jgi:hypothetical protein
MPSNSTNNNNANYGTVQSEKDKLPVYTARTSTDSTASTDALLKKETKTTSEDKKNLAEKAFLSGESMSCIEKEHTTNTRKLHSGIRSRCRSRVARRPEPQPSADSGTHSFYELRSHTVPRRTSVKVLLVYRFYTFDILRTRAKQG